MSWFLSFKVLAIYLTVSGYNDKTYVLCFCMSPDFYCQDLLKAMYTCADIKPHLYLPCLLQWP